LILGAHSDITNFGESHWIVKDVIGRDGCIDNGCRVHGRACYVINKIKKSMNSNNHLSLLCKHSDTSFICTSNKSWKLYAGMDIDLVNNKFIILYKPLEVWVGSFIGTVKIKKMPKNKIRAVQYLLQIYEDYYNEIFNLIESGVIKNDQYIVVNYMSFAKSPKLVMKDICNFLKIPYQGNMLLFNDYFISKDPNQHPIGGNYNTYCPKAQINSSVITDRYKKDFNNIYMEDKHVGILGESLINLIKKNKRYKFIINKLISLNSVRG